MTDERQTLWTFVRQVCRVRGQWFGHGQFAVLLTHWFYFTNHGYKGESRYWVRIGNWRKSFGSVRA